MRQIKNKPSPLYALDSSIFSLFCENGSDIAPSFSLQTLIVPFLLAFEMIFQILDICAEANAVKMSGGGGGFDITPHSHQIVITAKMANMTIMFSNDGKSMNWSQKKLTTIID